MQIKMAPRFKQRVQGLFNKYEFEVGVLNDKAHREAQRGKRGLKGEDVLSSYAGGPVRKMGGDSGKSIGEVSADLRERIGVNFYLEPFKNRNANIIKFSNEFFKYVFGRTQEKRAVNLLQAIVRNPILRGEYGSNSAFTKKVKGFDRYMIDTAQLFKNIKARIIRKVGK